MPPSQSSPDGDAWREPLGYSSHQEWYDAKENQNGVPEARMENMQQRGRLTEEPAGYLEIGAAEIAESLIRYEHATAVEGGLSETYTAMFGPATQQQVQDTEDLILNMTANIVHIAREQRASLSSGNGHPFAVLHSIIQASQQVIVKMLRSPPGDGNADDEGRQPAVTGMPSAGDLVEKWADIRAPYDMGRVNRDSRYPDVDHIYGRDVAYANFMHGNYFGAFDVDVALEGGSAGLGLEDHEGSSSDPASENDLDEVQETEVVEEDPSDAYFDPESASGSEIGVDTDRDDEEAAAHSSLHELAAEGERSEVYRVSLEGSVTFHGSSTTSASSSPSTSRRRIITPQRARSRAVTPSWKSLSPGASNTSLQNNASIKRSALEAFNDGDSDSSYDGDGDSDDEAVVGNTQHKRSMFWRA